MSPPDYRHISVMPEESIAWLNCRPGKVYVDCTLGGAGHSRAILERILPDGLLIGIDRDEAAIRNAEAILRPYGRNFRLFRGNFTRLPEFLKTLGIDGVDGILADLGLSLYQIEGSGRGFSFMRDEPLDMRMDTTTGVTAGELVNTLSEAELSRLFWEYGEERFARRIAGEIVRARAASPIASSLLLAGIVRRAVPRPPRKPKHGSGRRIHPATRVFMALRIAVNGELENVEQIMEMAPELLNPGGRLCVLTFHSLEDRIVKHRIKALEKGCVCPPDFPICVCNRQRVWRNLTRKGVRPTAAEVAANPMARSTMLRAAEKL
nr:16S rRNA (cytosine(1402)-N(4))-methyltransferase RsmH [Desulfonema ishimotonii]